MISKEVKPAQNEKTTEKNPEPVSFSSLPDEIAENCLARISIWNYTSLSLVSKKFLSWLSSPELYATRSRIGTTEPRFYFGLKLPQYPSSSWFTLWMKRPADEEALINEDGEFHDLLDDYSLVPVPPPSSSHPNDYSYFCTIAAGSEIYLIGAPFYAPPSSAVRILDCRNHTWRDGPSMVVARMYPLAVYLDEKIYVMGSCSGIKDSWMEVFDVKTQTWKPLPCHGAAAKELKSEDWLKINSLEGKIYASTAEMKNYLYDPKESTWEVVETHSIVETHSSSGYIDAWCVIENVMYSYTISGYCMWYDSKSRKWREVKGLHLVNLELLGDDRIDAFQGYVLGLHHYGGKLLVMWTSWYEDYVGRRDGRIWVAVISLEKSHDGCEILGKRVWGNTVFPPCFYGYEFLSCAVISI